MLACGLNLPPQLPCGIRYNSSVKQLILDLIPAPVPTFDNFVPGRNSEALEACIGILRGAYRVAASQLSMMGSEAFLPGRTNQNVGSVLYLWGETGSGKSHLLRSLGNEKSTLLLAAGDLENEIPDAMCYAVDNVQGLTDTQQVGLFNLINYVNQLEKSSCVVATGMAAPRDLALRPELTSRLGSGLVFQLHPLSDTEKAAALRAHAKARSFTLREEVIAYLLRHSRRDMASLISMLDALDIHSLETGREITLPLLREISQPQLPTV